MSPLIPRRLALAVLAVTGAASLAGCEIPATQKDQTGYRGTGMVNVQNPRIVADKAAANVVPAGLAPAPAVGPPAGAIYQNVQVLGSLSVPQFARLMVGITAWVSPQQGCNYCHEGNNLASDALYTKVVARRMLQMTQHINADWQSHVVQTGVTCYTCHQGQPVPSGLWSAPVQSVRARYAGNLAGQNLASPAVNSSSLPFDPFTVFLQNANEIRVLGTTALPSGNRSSIKQTEWTYALMVHMSQSLGVNCTYCHNSRSFSNWNESRAQRTTAWHGIRMVRGLNAEYIEPLTAVFPANRLGPAGDLPKVACETCHKGVYKPLLGVSMLQDYPELAAPLPPYVKPDAVPADGTAPPPVEGAPATPTPEVSTAPAT